VSVQPPEGPIPERKSILGSLRRPTLDESNRLYTAFMIGWGAVVGTVITFFLSGAILAAFFRLYQRKITLPVDRDVLWIGGAFASFFLAEALAGAIHPDGLATLRQVFENIPFLFFLFIYGRLSLSSREGVLRSVEIGVFTGAFATLGFALVDAFIQHSPRAEGMAGNAGPFGVICSVLYGFSLITGSRHTGAFRWIAALSAVSAAVALLLSGMRSLWPILLIAPSIPLVFFRPKLDMRTVWRIALIVAVPLIIAIFVSHSAVQSRIERFFTDVEQVEGGDYENSVGYRLRLWEVGLDLAKKNPIFGQGPSNAIAAAKAAALDENGNPAGFSHFHNFLLNAMVRAGLVGVAALLAMFIVPVWVAVRRRKDGVGSIGLALMLALEAAYLLSGSVGIMLGHDILDTLFIYGMIVTSFIVLGGPPSLPRAGGKQAA
jgi:O-antigen ligase